MKKITKLGMAAAVLFCVVGLGSHTQAVMAAEETTIENGISIGNVNVGGMTENQAISAVEEYVDGLMDTTFTLRGETGSIQMTAEDMGVTADADTAVQEALAVGHAGSRFWAMYRCQKMGRASTRLVTIWSILSETVRCSTRAFFLTALSTTPLMYA